MLAKEMIGLSSPLMMVIKVCASRIVVYGKVKVLRFSKMIEHDGRACIYGAFVSVDINDILMNDEFPILDVGRNIISKDKNLSNFDDLM
nr:hypothetical protein [Tanacetum cinerariifolium]